MKNALKFSGMAFQMGAIISLGTYGGYRWDLALGRWNDESTACATLGCSLFSTILALAIVLKQVINDVK